MTTRLQPAKRDDLQADEQLVWDAISETRGGVHGPYSVLMRIPELAKHMAAMGDYFRRSKILHPADREFAILVAAREVGSRYEWLRHEPLARQSGARPAAIEAVRVMSYGRLTDRELVIVEVVQTLFRVKALPSSLFGKAMSDLGEKQLIELISLAGFYCSIAFILQSFDIALPDGTKAPF